MVPNPLKKNVSQHFAPSPNPNVHPVLHLWLPHFLGIFGFRNPTFLLRFMHLATFRPFFSRKPQRAKKNTVGFFRKGGKLLEGMRVFFQQLTCQTPQFFGPEWSEEKSRLPKTKVEKWWFKKLRFLLRMPMFSACMSWMWILGKVYPPIEKTSQGEKFNERMPDLETLIFLFHVKASGVDIFIDVPHWDAGVLLSSDHGKHVAIFTRIDHRSMIL